MLIYEQNYTLIVEKNGMIEGYPFNNFRRVYATFDSVNSVWNINIEFVGRKNCPEDKVIIPLDKVTNQSGWTNNQTGAVQAVTDILGWNEPLSAGLASESTLQQIENNTDGIETLLAPRTLAVSIQRVTNAGTITAGKYSVSFASVGMGDSIIDAATLKSGEVVSVDAGALNNVLGAITYDASGTNAELLITTLQ